MKRKASSSGSAVDPFVFYIYLDTAGSPSFAERLKK
jgi:hypothetical protein